MLGEKLRELRESKGYLQRQVAAELDVDTAYVSKMEHNEKPVSRGHLKKLSRLFSISESELVTFWLAEKILQVVQHEKFNEEALKIVMSKVKGKA